MNQLLSFYGLKWNPFSAAIPAEALWRTPKYEHFCWRMLQMVKEGGFALMTGGPGVGKSCLMRMLMQQFETLRDVTVGVLTHPQSRLGDFYREMGDIFAVPLSPSNRWGSFKRLREKWQAHLASTTCRPILLIDEAQEVQDAVLNELRIMASANFDASSMMTICLAGDDRLVERLQTPELLPLATRIKARINLEPSTPQDLLARLQHVLEAAGNPNLMTTQLAQTLCERATGNPRVLSMTAGELLAAGLRRQLKQLDEKLYFELFDLPKQLKLPAPVRRRA